MVAENRQWNDNPDNPEILNYRLCDLKNDIEELKKDMKDMSKAVNEMTGVYKNLDEQRASLDAAWKEIRSIQETCLIRQQQIEWVKSHSRDETPQDWWERTTSTTLAHGVWIVVSVVVATMITKFVG